MDATGHNTPLSPDECRQLLRSQIVGRVSWRAESGILVLPVSYVLDGDRITFRTAPTSVLAALAEGHEVAFEIDDLDPTTLTGWNVLVQGTSGPADEAAIAQLPTPWVPGSRPVFISITPSHYSGRAVAAS